VCTVYVKVFYKMYFSQLTFHVSRFQYFFENKLIRTGLKLF